MGEEGPGAPQGCRGQLASPLGAVDAGKPCGPAWMFMCCPPSTCKAGGDKSLYPPLHLKIDTLKLMVPSEAQQSLPGVLKSPSPRACAIGPAWYGVSPPPARLEGPKLLLSVTPSTAGFWSLLMWWLHETHFQSHAACMHCRSRGLVLTHSCHSSKSSFSCPGKCT